MSATWLRWGRGTYHLVEALSTTSVCGREVGEDARPAVYSHVSCAICTRRAPELAEQAEERRRELAQEMGDMRAKARDRHRAGHFVVFRCRLCGVQHATPRHNGDGVAFCMLEGHPAELEAVEAQGPAWESA